MITRQWQLGLGPIFGAPGEAVTLRSQPLDVIFKPMTMLASDCSPSGGEAFKHVREIRFPHGHDFTVDGGLLLAPGGSRATIIGLIDFVDRGGVIEVDVVIPPSGKFAFAVLGVARC